MRGRAHDRDAQADPPRSAGTRAGPGATAHRGGDLAQGRVVGPAAHRLRGPARVHHLLDVGGAPERPLLRAALSLAVLLAVHRQVVRPLHVRLRLARLHVSDHRDRVAGVPYPVGARPLPADLLLLPQGLLPLVLAVTAGVRRPRRQGRVHRRDAVPAVPAEPPPVRLVRRGDLHRAAHVGRYPGLPVPRARRRPSPRRRRGHDRDVDQRDLPGRLHVLLPFLPPRVRRPREHVLEGADPLQGLALLHPAQRAPSGLRLALAVQRGSHRSLHPPRLDGRDPRPADRLLGERPMAMSEYETHEHDVLVIGAGGAGLRAAVEAAAQGVSVGLVCKSLLGKAHTVMAEGGIAASLGNVWPEDNWQVHFRDTMRGGKMLNNWRMAQLHAQEAPDRVLELERWGALFDRTKDGRILQRDFGGHRYARLAHVGDRTGLEMIRTLQYHGIHQGIDVYMECKVERLLKDGDRITGAVAYWRESGKLIVFKAPAVILATGGVGKSYEITSNSWEYTGDGHAMALRAGADLIDMEFVQFHPTGMVWPKSVAGILVTEGVRGDGGTLRNSKGERFMFRYIPEFFKAETADNEA